MEEDILQEVPTWEIGEVLKAMEKDWPSHFLFHHYVRVMKDHQEMNCKAPIQTLFRYGDIKDGVYLLQTTFPVEPKPQHYFFVYTTATDLSNLFKALVKTFRIPWLEKGYVFDLIPKRLTQPVYEAAVLKEVPFAVNDNLLLWFPPEEKLVLGDLPDETFLDYLNISHVPEMNKNWHHKFAGSDRFLAQQVTSNFGLGLFGKSNNRMLCSALGFHSGGIFVLYTDPEFRGRGYAEIIVRNMVKEIRHRGRIPFCTVLVENIPSQKLFKKVGFKEFYEVNFIFYRDVFVDIEENTEEKASPA